MSNNSDMVKLLTLMEGQQFAGEPEQKPGDQVRGTDQAAKNGQQHPFHNRLVGEELSLEDKLAKKYQDMKDVHAKKKTEDNVEEDAPAIAKIAGGLGLGLLGAAGAPAIVGILGPLLGIPLAAYGAYSAAKLGMSGVEKLWDMAAEKLGGSDKVEQYTTSQIAKLPPEKAKAATAAIKQVVESRQGVAEAGPFSYGKPPRKGSVADLTAKKRKEQERGQRPIEPKDQQVGVAKVTKGVAKGTGSIVDKCASLAAKYYNDAGLQHHYDIDEYIKINAGDNVVVDKCASLAAKYYNDAGLQHQYDIDEYIKAKGNKGVAEDWSQKYKSSINCSHPKGFSQKAHCAGKKKHNESMMTMEATCPDCGMCESHGSLTEIAKGQKDSNGFTKCWPGKHAEGTKKGKNGGQVRNCVPNESQGVAEGNMPQSVIRSKQKYADMTAQEFYAAHKNKSAEELQAMAWRHGYGKGSNHYVAKHKKGSTVTEGHDDHNPVVSAISRRVLHQRLDLLQKYGVTKVMSAIDEVADFVGDVEEIGSSDVSGWIRHVERTLGNMGELAEADVPPVAGAVPGAVPPAGTAPATTATGAAPAQNPADMMKQKNDQRKAIQDQITATTKQLADLRTQLSSIQ